MAVSRFVVSKRWWRGHARPVGPPRVAIPSHFCRCELKGPGPPLPGSCLPPQGSFANRGLKLISFGRWRSGR